MNTKFPLGFLSGVVTTFLMILFIITVGDTRSTTHFYVKSSDKGYDVCIDHGKVTMCLGKPSHDPTDAKILSEKLNRDMEGNWEE